MGYYTDNFLTVYKADDPKAEFDTASDRYRELLDALQEIPDFVECAEYGNGPFEIEGLDWTSDSTRYSPQQELVDLSKRFPDMLFDLYCEGEDHCCWSDYILNGRLQHAEAVVPDFDPKGEFQSYYELGAGGRGVENGDDEDEDTDEDETETPAPKAPGVAPGAVSYMGVRPNPIGSFTVPGHWFDEYIPG